MARDYFCPRAEAANSSPRKLQRKHTAAFHAGICCFSASLPGCCPVPRVDDAPAPMSRSNWSWGDSSELAVITSLWGALQGSSSRMAHRDGGLMAVDFRDISHINLNVILHLENHRTRAAVWFACLSHMGQPAWRGARSGKRCRGGSLVGQSLFPSFIIPQAPSDIGNQG
jgi:hypothetical protein